MSISRINNPDFAEKLLSTFYCGTSMSIEEESECEKIWNECNNVRFEVLKKVVEICGDINTPQSRYIKAKAWSFNSTMYSEQRINAINDYLNNKLYFNAYKNSFVTLDKGLKKGKENHKIIFLKYLADAYNSLKQYDKCEQTYFKIIKYDLVGYIYLADFYRKQGNIDKAIDILNNKGKKSFICLFNKEYRVRFNRKIKEYQKLKIGERVHSFTCYDTYPSTWINGIYRKDLEQAHMNLRNQYSDIFENHRLFINNIEHIEHEYKVRSAEILDNNDYETNLLNDISLYDKIMEFYNKLNKLGFQYKFQYEDNRIKEYSSFKKLINYYSKNKQYKNAIKICEYAISKGMVNYTPKKSFEDKIKEFEKFK